MSEQEIISTLRGMPLFKMVDDEHLEHLTRHSRILDLEKDAFLFHKGDPCNGLYVIIRGKIKILFLSADGKEHVVRIMSAGDHFAEAIMFIDKPSPASTQAITGSRVLFVAKDAIMQCIEENSLFARKMLAGLSFRLHQLITELESITLYSSMQRVIGYLLQNEQSADAELYEADVTLPVSKAIIAAHLNLTPETLSRVLHSLSEKGLVSLDGKVVHINNIEKLRTFS
ncbi:MAG: Crp/Fnr family transcriptional regulator [Mariprofundaceae bacterium]